MEMEYIHPDFPQAEATKRVVKDEENHKIVRLEYPDGVIVVFDMTLEGINVTSNYGFRTDGYKVSPNLNHKEANFKDVL